VEYLRDKYGLKDDISVSLIAKFPDILKVENPKKMRRKSGIFFMKL